MFSVSYPDAPPIGKFGQRGWGNDFSFVYSMSFRCDSQLLISFVVWQFCSTVLHHPSVSMGGAGGVIIVDLCGQ